MNTLKIILLITIAFITVSCSNDNDNQLFDDHKVGLSRNEILSISYYDAKELTEEDAIKLVSSFSKVINNEATRSTATSFKVTKKTYINEEGEFEDEGTATRASAQSNVVTSEICEITFKNGSDSGLAVVATDKRRPAVIAYIPKYNVESMKKNGAAELLQSAKATYLYEAITTKELVDSLRIPTLEKISNELKMPIEDVTYERIKDYVIITDATPSTRVSAVQEDYFYNIQVLNTSILPLVTTNWGQDYPYNEYFTQRNHMDWVADGRGGCNYAAVPAGCVNIALAQIMTYTLRSSNKTFPIPGTSQSFIPNWSLMTKKPKIDDPGISGTGRIDATRVICALYEMNNTTSDKDDYGWVTGSSVSESSMLNTMNKYLLYDSKASFNGDAAWASLRSSNPVLMLTKDHAFIISGILITEKQYNTRELVKTNDVYWHANFGWGDNDTGYYKLDHNANTRFDAGGKQEWCYKNEYIKNIRSRGY